MTWHERSPAPLSWWLLGTGVAVLAAAEIHGGAGGWRAVVPYVVLPGAVLAALAWLSRHQLVIADRVLHVPGARAPLMAFGPPEVLDREQLRLWRGPRAHRDAWVRVCPWQRQAVRLPVVDPGDDTPYWLVGTRRAQELARAIEEQQ